MSVAPPFSDPEAGTIWAPIRGHQHRIVIDRVDSAWAEGRCVYCGFRIRERLTHWHRLFREAG